MDLRTYQGVSLIEKEHWWYVGRRQILGKLFPRYLEILGNKKKKILSVGCGMGEELKFLSNYGEAFGIDENENAITFCKLSGVDNLIKKASAANIPFADLFFDAIFALDVLEHIEDESAALNEMKRVLKSEGVIFLTVPALRFLWSNADKRAHHFRRYNKRELSNKLNSGGLEAIYLTYFNTILFPPIAVLKIWSRFSNPKILEGAEVSMPPAPVNILLKFLFSAEALLLSFIKFPFGVSLLAVVRKKKD